MIMTILAWPLSIWTLWICSTPGMGVDQLGEIDFQLFRRELIRTAIVVFNCITSGALGT